MLAASEIESNHPDVSVRVADARFMKPLDGDLIAKLSKESDIMITIEEGSVGGFGSHVQVSLSLRFKGLFLYTVVASCVM